MYGYQWKMTWPYIPSLGPRPPTCIHISTVMCVSWGGMGPKAIYMYTYKTQSLLSVLTSSGLREPLGNVLLQNTSKYVICKEIH